MKPVYFIIFFCILCTSNNHVFAQSNFAILEKNINVRAKGLNQQLNASKDTLILQSSTIISKVYSVNMDYTREIDLAVQRKTVKIPLHKLSKGKHVFVAVQSPVRIVFVVKIIGENRTFLALKEDK